MAADPLEIHIDPESETGRLLERARERPIRLVIGPARYRVEAEDGRTTEAGAGRPADSADPFATYDPERAAAAWRAFADANVFEGVDTEALKAELREQRGQDTPGRPGW